jgi:hypothetical protein
MSPPLNSVVYFTFFFFRRGKMNEHPRYPTGKKWLKSMLPLVAAMSLVLSCTIFSTPPPTATNTPKPTDTSAPTDTSIPIDTPQPAATKKPTSNKAATQRAQQAETDAAGTNFAGEVLTEISNSLETVGERMGAGTVIYWYPNPIPVESSKANIVTHEDFDPSIQAADFAFHSNITWEVKQKVGIVYCLMMFRISGDLNMDSWYMMRMGRISGLGHVLFDVMQGWNIVGESDGDVSNYIRDGNGDTNDVLLVARANQFYVYVNGKQVSVWWNTKIDRGGFGIGTLQDTGTSICTFTDNWIWEFD